MFVAVMHSDLGVPAIVLNLTKELIVNHHLGTARLMMIEADEATITVLFLQVGEVFGDDVGMYVYLHG